MSAFVQSLVPGFDQDSKGSEDVVQNVSSAEPSAAQP